MMRNASYKQVRNMENGECRVAPTRDEYEKVVDGCFGDIDSCPRCGSNMLYTICDGKRTIWCEQNDCIIMNIPEW